MSLASDYAATQTAAAVTDAAALAAAPAPFVGPNGRAEVTPQGNLRLVPTTGGQFEIPPAGALAFSAWIVTTFG
jgi:hypothetical protein